MNLKDNEKYLLTKRVFKENFRQYQNRYIFAGLLMAIGAIATGLSAFLMRDVFNTALKGGNTFEIIQLGLIFMAVFITKGFATYGYQVTLAKIGNNLMTKLRLRVFSHLINLPASYFDRTTLGEIVTRISSGANATVTIISSLITSFGRDTLTLLALVIVMFYQAPLISLIAILIGPLAVSQISRLVSKSKVHSAEQLDISAEVSKIEKETIAGVTVIKTYNLEELLKKQLSKALQKFEIRANKLSRLLARTSPFMESLGGIVIGLVVIYAGWRATDDPEYPGQLMSFITAFLLAYDPAKRLARLRVSIEPHFVGIQYMYELIDNECPEQNPTQLPQLKVNVGKIQFENVSFDYSNNLPVLHDVSFSVSKGEKIALIGVSGSGKTTIFKLLLALYQTRNGTIKIDGQNTADVDVQSIRKNIAYVGQDSYVFTGTVKENIQYGKPNATKLEIESAAKSAYAHEFISQLPNGYESFVGEGGTLLSGGQKQRLAIARAFLKDAPIILLDEATSALDSKSENKIQNAVKNLLSGRTTIVIAHRLSTVIDSDRIYVLQAGRVVESGSHTELIENDGVYTHLYKLQYEISHIL